MNNLDDELTGLLTDQRPTGPDGPAVGLPQLSSGEPEQPATDSIPPEPGLQAGPGKSGPSQSSAVPPKSSAPDSRPETGAQSSASLLGLPDELPITWCPNCKADVKPVNKGQCPRCYRMLKGSFTARRHPVNVMRRDQILKKLVADYGPQTTMLRATCEHLAGTLEQLESLKPGSPEHQRLVGLSQQLGGALEESRSSRVAPPPTDLGALSNEQLIEKTTEILRGLIEANDADKKGRALIASARPDPDHAGQETIIDATTPREPKIEQRCGYGCGTLARCAEIKESRPEAWAALHFLDPSEVARRDAAATKEMMHQLGKPSPWL